MKTLINKMAYVPNKKDRENGPWKSQTVPDEALTVKEIFHLYAKNQPLGGRVTSTMDSYSDTPQDYVSLDDPDLMELSRMDLTDKHEYMETLKESIEEKKRSIKAAQEALLRKQEAHAKVEADLKDFEKQVDKQADPKKVVKKPVKTAPEEPKKDG